MYHRSCFKRNNRKTDSSAYITPPSQSLVSPAADTSNRRISAGLKLASQQTLPSTDTPPSVDTRPEWQRNIQSKSTASKRLSGLLSGRPSEAKQLDPVSETGTTSQNSYTPTTPVNNNTKPSPNSDSKVTMRSRPPPTSTGRPSLPRAVSTGVNLDEKIAKLRELRKSSKSRDNSPAVKERLAKLQDRLNEKKMKEALDETESPSPVSKSGSSSPVIDKKQSNTESSSTETTNQPHSSHADSGTLTPDPASSIVENKVLPESTESPSKDCVQEVRHSTSPSADESAPTAEYTSESILAKDGGTSTEVNESSGAKDTADVSDSVESSIVKSDPSTPTKEGIEQSILNPFDVEEERSATPPATFDSPATVDVSMDTSEPNQSAPEQISTESRLGEVEKLEEPKTEAETSTSRLSPINAPDEKKSITATDMSTSK